MPYVTLLSDWQDLANKAFKAVNGDRGGTWAPTSPIIIGGDGLSIDGPTVVNFGGTLKTLGGSRFQLGNNEWPKLGTQHVGRSRTLRSPIHTRVCTPRYMFADCPTFTGSIQSMACTIVRQTTIEQPTCFVPLRVHDGSRLISGVMKFRVPKARTKAPVVLPRFRIIRVDADGKIESLRAASSTVDGDGYSSFPAVTSGAVWYASGAAQEWAFACDQKNTIDTSLYTYYVQFYEEVGGVLGDTIDGSLLRERKLDVAYVFNGLLSDSPDFTGEQIITGGVPSTGNPNLLNGDTVLIVDSGAFLGGSNVRNGIWTVTPGTWTRRVDLSVPSDFTPAFLVFDRSFGVLWECTGPAYGSESIKVSTGVGATVGASIINFKKRVPRGNIYHSITCVFDQISDMRPQ